MSEYNFKVGDIVDAELEQNRHTMGIIAVLAHNDFNEYSFLVLSDAAYNIGYGGGVTWVVTSRLKVATVILTEPWWKNRVTEAYNYKRIDNLTYIELLDRLNQYAK